MPKYLDLSANVSVSMTEIIGAKPAPESVIYKDVEDEDKE